MTLAQDTFHDMSTNDPDLPTDRTAASSDTSPTERITDPLRIRALAHPLRLRLLDLLDEGELTASECAELTGESPASCSFHLRTLAKYGYITRGTPRGREKPWRVVSRQRDIRPDDADPASVHALGAMAGLALDQATGHVRAWIDRLPVEDTEWVEASTIVTGAIWATAEELAELGRTIQHLADPFRGREDDPASRPPGARPVRVLGVTSIDVEREQRMTGDRGRR